MKNSAWNVALSGQTGWNRVVRVAVAPIVDKTASNQPQAEYVLRTDAIEVHKPGAIQQALGKRSRFGGLMRGAS